METKIHRLIKYLKYSGVSVILTFNPAHWRFVPYARAVPNTEWPSPNEHMFVASWLFLTVRVWIDDGSW